MRSRQHPGCFLQPRQGGQPFGLRGPPRRADQPGSHQLIENIQGVIDSGRFQMPRDRHQRGGTPGLGQLGHRHRLAAKPVAGQRRQAVRRHGGHIDGPGADPGQLVHPVQRADHFRARVPPRRTPQPLQFREPGPVADLQQPVQARGQYRIGRGRGLGQHHVKPRGRGIPDLRHQPGQHADPGQHYPFAAQPRHRPREQRRRPLGMRPCPPLQERPYVTTPSPPRPRTGGSRRSCGSPTHARKRSWAGQYRPPRTRRPRCPADRPDTPPPARAHPGDPPGTGRDNAPSRPEPPAPAANDRRAARRSAPGPAHRGRRTAPAPAATAPRRTGRKPPPLPVPAPRVSATSAKQSLSCENFCE